MAATPAAQPVESPGRSLLRRVLRIGVLTVAVLLLAAGFSLWVVTRSWFLVGRIEPALEEILGGDVEVGEATYHGNGQLLLRNLALRAPGIDGPGGEICRIGRAELHVDVEAYLGGRIVVHNVKINQVLVRMSEDLENAGSFNFMALDPKWPEKEDNEAAIVVPEIRITRTTVEMGHHHEGEFERLGSRILSGSLSPRQDADGWFDVTLAEVDEHGHVLETGGFILAGEWNAATNQHAFRIRDLELDSRTYGMCPQLAKLWWDKMELSGRVQEAQFRWSEFDDLEVGFDIEQVGLTVPVEAMEVWARYRDGAIESVNSQPRMNVDKGTITLTPHSISLNSMEGTLTSAADADNTVAVPYEMNLEIKDIPELDLRNGRRWLDEALKTVPFSMQFRSDEFRVRADPGESSPAVELPAAVGRVLERFQLTDWELSTSIEIWRDSPAQGASGKVVPQDVKTKGQAYISEARGAYRFFPYPLENVEAYLEFDQDQVTVHYLTGLGSEGATVRLTGVIAPLDREAGVNLQLIGRNVPVDERLLEALPTHHQMTFRSLLHDSARASLENAGLLRTEEHVESARRVRDELLSERRALSGPSGHDDASDDDRSLELEEALTRTQSILAAGSFHMGGMIDLDLDILREVGPDQRTMTTGRIKVNSLGIVFDRFPYPISLIDGSLRVEENVIVIESSEEVKGLQVVTHGGGDGWVTGSLHIRQDGDQRVAVPDFMLIVENDVVNDALLAAIPLSSEERANPALTEQWPGGALAAHAAWLRDLHVEGDLDYAVRFSADEENRLEFLADVELTNGIATPVAAMTEMFGHDASLDEGEWVFTNCHGRLTIDRSGVRITDFTAQHQLGTVEIDGQVAANQTGEAATLNVRIQQMQFSEELLDFIAAENQPVIRDMWDRYRPEGIFDAEFSYRRVNDEIQPRHVRIVPANIIAHVEDESVEFTRTRGAVVLSSDDIEFDDLALEVTADARDEGTIELNGAIPFDASSIEAAVACEGSWTDGRFESPVLRDVLEHVSADPARNWIVEHEVQGGFHAKFRMLSGLGDQPSSYEVDLTPLSAALTMRDTPIFLEFEKESRFVFTPGLMTLSSVAGRNVGGSFNVNGDVRIGPTTEANLTIDFDGRVTSAQVRSVLPEIVPEIFSEVSFEEGSPSRIEDARVHIVHHDEGVQAAHTAVNLRAEIELNDVSFDPGIACTEVSGPIDLQVEHATGTPAKINLVSRTGSMKTLGQHLTGIHARMEMNEDGTVFLMPDFRATAGHGVVTANASIDVGEMSDYKFTVQVAGVPLSDFLLDPARKHEGRDQSAASGPEGELFARLDLYGDRRDPSARYGRGSCRMVGGRLADISLILQVVNLLQGTVSPDAVDYAVVEFFVNGNELVLEQVVFEGTRGDEAWLEMQGTGTMDLTTYELDARFQSRSAVAIIKDLVGGIGDKLVAIEVTGPIWKPEAKLIYFPSGIRPGSSAHSTPPVVRAEGGHLE